MPDQSEAPIVRDLLMAADQLGSTGTVEREAAEIIRLCEEALTDWENCWHCPATDFDAQVPRLLEVTDALRAKIKGQNP